ncbi:hypothetical protein WN865_00980 [Tetragenococcus halophilus]
MFLNTYFVTRGASLQMQTVGEKILWPSKLLRGLLKLFVPIA